MNLKHRPYNGANDLQKMKQLAREGQKASPQTAYFHFGDLDWWIFYGVEPQDRHSVITIWEDENGAIMGWQMYDPFDGMYDAVIHPSLRGTNCEAQMIDWAEAWLGERLKAENKPIVAFVYKDDSFRVKCFEERSYKPDNGLVLFNYPLDGELPTPRLPEGYTLLDKMRPEYASKRRDLHVGAFTRSNMTPEEYLGFMQDAPDYDPELDVVVVAPDGTFASFALTWVDPISGYGEFEPVGTRTDQQRKGLGKAALWEGLHRMKARGMKQAKVSTWAEDEGNVVFYNAVGFTEVNRILRYIKPLE